MLRKIGISIATAAVVAPSLAAALSVGNYQLNSHLNQPLDLRVQLSDVRGLDEHEIVARLATKREFDNAGIEFDPINNGLTFTVKKLGGDRAEVRIVSREVVREPFVSLLVEYVWPRGRMLREYNLLLNPPTYSAAGAVPRTPAQQEEASPQPRQQSERQATAPDEPGKYTIRQNDTLWEVAARHRPSRNVSVQQTMLAIQDKNPSAFINNNINLLRSGATLDLPTENEVRQSATAQAEVEVQRKAAERTSAAPSVDDANAEQGRVTLVGDDEEATVGESTAKEESKTTVEAPSDTDEVAAEQEGVTGTADGDVADAQQERFLALEEQLQSAEDKLQLKDERINELQLVLLRLQEQGVDIDPSLLVDVELADFIELAGDEAAAEEAIEEALAIETTEEQLTEEEPLDREEELIEGLDDSFDIEAAEADSSAEVEAADEPAEEEKAEEVAIEEAPMEKAATEATESDIETEAAVPAQPASSSKPGLLKRLLGNSLLVFSLLGLFALSLLLWLLGFVRRQRQEETLFIEPHEEAADTLVAPAVNVDVIKAEAAALVADERYAEAVTVLRTAGQQNPADIELKELLLAALFHADKKAYQQEVTTLKGMNAELDRFIDEQQSQQGTAQFDGFGEVPIVTETFVGDADIDGITEVEKVAETEEPELEAFIASTEEELNLTEKEESSIAFSEAETLAATDDIDQLIAEIESIDDLAEPAKEEQSKEGLSIVQEDYDEHDTGLGLARAMINMGNNEDARDILEEVLRGGNEEQQAAAQQLLDEMSQ